MEWSVSPSRQPVSSVHTVCAAAPAAQDTTRFHQGVDYRIEARLDEEIWALIPDRNLRQFEKRELADLVASVLARMPAPMARALSGFFMDGKTQEEMGEEAAKIFAFHIGTADRTCRRQPYDLR